MNPITRKSMSQLVTQPSFRAVGQTHAEWWTFENPENKRQMYDYHTFLLFSVFSNVYHLVCVWPTALKLDCTTNFGTLFLVMGFISFEFMLISSHHICIRSISECALLCRILSGFSLAHSQGPLLMERSKLMVVIGGDTP